VFAGARGTVTGDVPMGLEKPALLDKLKLR
jgi:hypothetical protein